MKELRLILGDQLNPNHSWFESVNPKVQYVLIESKSETEYVKHHIQKLVSIFLAMRSFRDFLVSQGHKVIYVELNNNQSNHMSEEVIRICNEKKIDSFSYQLPDEYRVDEELKNLESILKTKYSIQTNVFDTEHYFTSRSDLKIFFGSKQYRMEYFYRNLRKKFNILVNKEGLPLGGEWNYDEKNRKKYDGKVSIKKRSWKLKQTSEILGVFKNTPSIGSISETIIWPINRKESLEYLDDFLHHYFLGFGPYQDAMIESDPFLFHSCLSFSLNTKQISPKEVIEKSIEFYNHNQSKISLSTLEGFVRQILGWREFMRGVYWAEMPNYQSVNFFEHKNSLPNWMWDANTKMHCLSSSIKQSLEYAYAHHIQRLMVIGNFLLLYGADPDLVDLWYLGIYIDAFQWVEITNTRGMSQFADGGKIASKPYISSANYLDKMSDYCKNCFYNKNTKAETNSCPYNSLYWDFLVRHRKKLESNHRIGFSYKIWDKFGIDEKKKILKRAEYVKLNCEDL